jgi:pimeloyl-ACP methyl ester carboxylesterase
VPRIQVAGAELHYTESGTGGIVVLVHGGLADYRLWGRLSDVLSRRFRVVSYSRRGAFPNEAPKRNSSGIPVHSADLASLISQLSDAPVHLVGESYGGYVAAHCALHSPDMARSLAIDEPPILSLLLDNEDDRADLACFEAGVLKPALEHYARGRPDDAARVLLGYLEGSPDIYDSLPQETKEVIAANSEAMSNELRGGFDGIKKEELADMKTPTLLMKSEYGPELLKRVVDRVYALIPNRTLAMIEGTSHGTIVNSPAYCTRVLEFLTRS